MDLDSPSEDQNHGLGSWNPAMRPDNYWPETAENAKDLFGDEPPQNREHITLRPTPSPEHPHLPHKVVAPHLLREPLPFNATKSNASSPEVLPSGSLDGESIITQSSGDALRKDQEREFNAFKDEDGVDRHHPKAAMEDVFGLSLQNDIDSLDGIRFPEYATSQRDEAPGPIGLSSDHFALSFTNLRSESHAATAWDLGQMHQKPSEDSIMNRTNSFPEVPTLYQEQSSAPHPLSLSQAVDILNESNESVTLASGHDEGSMSSGEGIFGISHDVFDLGTPKGSFTHWGGSQEATSQSPADEEARFEEGLPLISSRSYEKVSRGFSAEAQNKVEASSTSFDRNEKDFFGKASEDPQDDLFNFRPQPLDRKTTTQVLDSLQFLPQELDMKKPEHTEDELTAVESPAQGVTASTTAEMSQLSAEKQVEGTQLKELSSDAKTPPEADLAALWQAALGDDELLEEDESQLDPSSFFEEDGQGFLEDTQEHTVDGPLSHQLPSPDSQSNFRNDINMEGFNPSSGHSQSRGPVPQSRYLPTPSKFQIHPSSGDFSQQENSRVVDPLSSYMTTNLPHSFSAPVALEGPHRHSLNALPSRPQMPETAQSFSDKSKGGYKSPYDLPMDVTRPKKRTQFQQTQTSSNLQAQSHPLLPPRSSSMYPGGVPRVESNPPISNALSSKVLSTVVHSRTPSTKASAPALGFNANASSFFEELPSSKPRPSSSRGRPATAVFQSSQTAQIQREPPRSNSTTQQSIPSSFGNSQRYPLLPPERIGLYAQSPQQGSINQAVPAMKSSYSPAPVSQISVLPPGNRYVSSPSGGSRPPPPSQTMSFQPRTSSPLAQSNPMSSHHQLPTGDVALRDTNHPKIQTRPLPLHLSSNLQSRTQPEFDAFSAVKLQAEPGTPLSSDSYLSSQPSPPSHGDDLPMSAPPPRSSYAPQNHQSYNSLEKHLSINDTIASPNTPERTMKVSEVSNFGPPRRSQTQSPSAMRSKQQLPVHLQEPYQRPASTNHQNSSSYTQPALANTPPRRFPHSKSLSQRFDYIRPSDGRENDPLERWKGCPILRFGFGGMTVLSFPKQIPRYSAGQATPMIKCSPGEVKINAGKLFPLEQVISSFPGPLKSKSKKKEVVEWLQMRISGLAATPVPNAVDSVPSGSLKRYEEKILLWKILQTLVDNDGNIEGNPAVMTAVRNILSPELDVVNTEPASLHYSNQGLTGISKSDGPRNKKLSADPEALEGLRRILLRGEREEAVWHAVDQQLWAHAMLLASTLDRRVWKQVLEEFVRQEVKTLGQNTESLSSLYQIFAGNWEESVDELVPPSARVGLQMVSKVAGAGPTKNALDGLDRWRESLTLILSNRSQDDWKALLALGRLLSGYGRTEAAHVCFIFAKAPGIFGGADDPQVSVALLGADHVHQPLEYTRDFDSILLTEIYDFACTVLAPAPVATFSPHLQSYKLYHAMVLAEHGYRSEAQQYCDAITGVLKATTKLSPYYHGLLFGALEDLIERLRQAPTDDSASWMSRPSMDKVSGSVWARLNQFIAGDESETGSAAPGKGMDHDVSGPFARVVGDSPIISQPASSSDLYNGYFNGNMATGPARGANLPNSRYAPAGQYTPRSSLEQTRAWPSQEPRQESYGEGLRPVVPHQQYQPRSNSTNGAFQESQPNSYKQLPEQIGYSPQSLGYLPTPPSQPEYMPLVPPDMSPSLLDHESYRPTPPPKDQQQEYHHLSDEPQSTSVYEPSSSTPNSSYYPPPPNSYDPPTTNSYEPPIMNTYEPPSTNTYESPSYNPDSPSGDDTLPDEKPKKSFMDDDDDDFTSRAAADLKAEKAKKDREVDEAFRKAAEADGMFYQCAPPFKSI